MNRNEMIRRKNCEIRDRYIRIYGEEAYWNRMLKFAEKILEENKEVFMRLKDK